MAALRIIAAAAGWTACVLGAAHGQPLVGPAVVVVILIAHASSLADPLRQLRPVLVVGVVGTLLESAAIAAGAYVPNEAMRGTPFAPLWITALWLNAAVLVQGVCGCPSRVRPLVAALAGAVATPAGYSAASQLHALAVGWSTPAAIAAAAVYGAIVAPAVLWLISRPNSRLSESPAAPSPESTHG
jgi:hypothetical protein